MSHTIKLTDEQFEAINKGESITIEPPKNEPKIWKPVLGGRLNSVFGDGGIYTGCAHFDTGKYVDNFNCFKTEAIAKAAAKRMRISNALISSALAVDPDFSESPNHLYQDCYTPQYSRITGEWQTNRTSYRGEAGVVSTKKRGEHQIGILNGLDIFADKE